MNTNDRLAVDEILEKYPELITKLNMGKRELAVMVRCHMVAGHYNTTTRCAMISESSLLNMISHANSVIQSNIIDLSNPTSL